MPDYPETLNFDGNDDSDWGNTESYLSDPNLPKRLHEFDPTDLQDPHAALEIVEILQEEQELAGKRRPKLAREAQEGLDYLFELYPEFERNAKTNTFDSPEIEDLDKPFSGESRNERVEWLQSLHNNWLSKQHDEDSRVEVIDNPLGEGHVLQHENTELGLVKTDLADPDLSTSGIATFETIEEAKEAIDTKGLQEVKPAEQTTPPPATSENESEANTSVLPQPGQGLKGKQLSLFDTIEFVNPEEPAETTSPVSRDNFTAKGLEILDSEKRWPKLADEPMSGWAAMELAVEKGYISEKLETTPTEYRINQEDTGISIRVKKVEFDLFNQLPNLASLQTVKDEAEKAPKEETKEELEEKINAARREIGRSVFADLDLSDKTAQEAGLTYELLKKGVLNQNDWNHYSAKLREQNEPAKGPSIRDGFTNKGLEILDSEKRWPKLADDPMNGWDAMKVAIEEGFKPIIKQKENGHTEYFLENEDKVTVRLKKAELDLYAKLVLNGKENQAADNEEKAESKTTQPDSQEKTTPPEKSQEIPAPKEEVKLDPIKQLLADTWPTPASEIERHEVLVANAKTEIQRESIADHLADLKENQVEAERQMKSQGYLDEELGSLYKSLPSEFNFARNLFAEQPAKSPEGSVFEIELTGNNNHRVIEHLFDGSQKHLQAESGESWTLHQATNEAIKAAGFTAPEQKQEADQESAIASTPPKEKAPEPVKEEKASSQENDSREIHTMDFKTFLFEIHDIDAANLGGKGKGSQTEIQEYIQEWGTAISQAIEEGKDVPGPNQKALQSAITQGLFKPANTQVESTGDQPVETAKEQQIFYDYGLTHPRGVGMGASPPGHVQYDADLMHAPGGSINFLGGVVTYDKQLSLEEMNHYSYIAIGTRTSLDDQPDLAGYESKEYQKIGRKALPEIDWPDDVAEDLGRAYKAKNAGAIPLDEWLDKVESATRQYGPSWESDPAPTAEKNFPNADNWMWDEKENIFLGKFEHDGRHYDLGVHVKDIDSPDAAIVFGNKPGDYRSNPLSFHQDDPVYAETNRRWEEYKVENNIGTDQNSSTDPAPTTEKYFPGADDWMWNRENNVFLGKFELEGRQYDLGVNVDPNTGAVSAAIVDGNEPGSYQSGALDKFTEHSPLYQETDWLWEQYKQYNNIGAEPINVDDTSPASTPPTSEPFVMPKKAYEITQNEFVEQVGSLDNPNPALAVYVSTYYPDSHKEEIDKQVEAGDFASPAEYIHKQVIKEAIGMHVDISPTVMADYPDLKPPKPELWEASNNEILQEPKSFMKNSGMDETRFMKQLIAGTLHKNAVTQAVEEGLPVPDKAIEDHPELLQVNDSGPRMR